MNSLGSRSGGAAATAACHCPTRPAFRHPQQERHLAATSVKKCSQTVPKPAPADNLAHTTYTSTFPNPAVAEIVKLRRIVVKRQRLQNDRWLAFFLGNGVDTWLMVCVCFFFIMVY